jgi:hypothetical protein
MEFFFAEFSSAKQQDELDFSQLRWLIFLLNIYSFNFTFLSLNDSSHTFRGFFYHFGLWTRAFLSFLLGEQKLFVRLN